MKVPYPEPKEQMYCPECGSGNVEFDKSHEVKSTQNGVLKQYKCNDCNISFIPAILTNKVNENYQKWARTVRLSEGNNNGKSWKDEKIEYIIIRDI